MICWDGPIPLKTTSDLYKKVYGHAQEIYDILRLAMNKISENHPVEPSKVTSDIDELKELVELKRQGIITEEEFVAMKTKIINR